jgi:integrase/recombinase XerC
MRHAERFGNKRDADIVMVLLNMDVGISELCNLKWHDSSLSERKGRMSTNAGKGCKHCGVPLNIDARLAIVK